jgi:CHAT domain-containing protein
MKAFYGHLQSGASKAHALQAAMRALRERYPHPFYWAPFVLIGQP